jgi:hypothetical protein
MDGRTGRETERQTDRQTDIEHYIARTIATIHSFPFYTFMFPGIFGIPNQPAFLVSLGTLEVHFSPHFGPALPMLRIPFR